MAIPRHLCRHRICPQQHLEAYLDLQALRLRQAGYLGQVSQLQYQHRTLPVYLVTMQLQHHRVLEVFLEPNPLAVGSSAKQNHRVSSQHQPHPHQDSLDLLNQPLQAHKPKVVACSANNINKCKANSENLENSKLKAFSEMLHKSRNQSKMTASSTHENEKVTDNLTVNYFLKINFVFLDVLRNENWKIFL